MTLSVRSRSTATPAVEEEREENDSVLTVAAENGRKKVDQVKRLWGKQPIYFRPEGQFVDAVNEMVFFYWQDVEHGPYRLSSLSLRTGKWMEKVCFSFQYATCRPVELMDSSLPM